MVNLLSPDPYVVVLFLRRMSGNAVNLLNQLRDAQEKLRVSEARIKVLEEENRKLRAQVSSSTNGAALQRKIDALAAEQDALTVGDGYSRNLRIDELEAHDKVLREMKQQLVDLTRRNAVLERDQAEHTSVMRRQYETHIDSLELDLRRARAVAGGVYRSQAAEPAAQPTFQPNAMLPSSNQRSVQSPSTVGRTVESRRQLL